MNEERVAVKQRERTQRWQERQDRSRASRTEIESLCARVAELRQSMDAKQAEPESVETSAILTRFTELPMSQRTQLGLERGHYTRMTPVQSDSLPLALAGLDVLGAARTGSGKTLCFVIPLLERLYRERWEPEMGVGALVLSPTRELALQIFKVLQLIGYRHVFSAALLTGGRDVAEERRRLHAISIIVGTPGRVLHHLEDDASVSLDNLQLFVMDEADRLLDMGFREALLSILRYLPSARQTLLFSATQTTDVQMLAQMSLREARYVSAHAITAAPTPTTLCQNFMVVELHRKLDALLLFLRRHPNDKIVVFVSTCNQVRYMYLTLSKILKKMRIPSMCLTSKMKQFRREEVFLTFCRCKSAVLLCTDVAARGLDFPLVHWVVQYDCPDSAQTYIHRAGRTARAGARGVSLLLLTPREVPMLSFLAHKRVPLREIQFRHGLLQESREIFVALVVQGLKYEAQKAFIAYLRSVYFASNKAVFDVASIDVEKFALSLGLLKVPDMSELQNMQRGAKNLSWDIVNYMSQQEKQKKKQQQEQQTRREKHLAASDMFRTLQQRQRYATNDDSQLDKDTNGSQTKRQEGKEEEDGEEDDFLVKKTSTNPNNGGGNDNHNNKDKEAAQRAAMQLTVEERMAGLSKRKIRKYIETADLRVRDLGLSKRVVFHDEDEEEEEEEEEKKSGEQASNKTRNTNRPTNKKKSKSNTDDNEEEEEEEAKFMARRITPANAASDSDSDPNVDYTERLRRRVMAQRDEDTERAKRLRRLRRLQKEGKIAKSTALEESGVTSVVGGERSRGHGEEYDDDESDDESLISSGGSLSRLIRAAKGELYADEEEDEDHEANADAKSTDREEEEEVVKKERKQPPRKRQRRA